MYNIFNYGEMINGDARVTGYAEALRQIVRPESVVLEIGTGTGFFAMIACRLGARKVYAIEPDNVIQLARETAAANGFADRIDFIQGMSEQTTLPEPVDIIVSDIRGRLPLFYRHIPTIIDARERLLAAGGSLIPHRDTMWAAVVDAPEIYSRFTDPWHNNGHRYDLDFSASIRLALNTWNKGRVRPDQLLVEPACWAKIEYASVDSPDVYGEATWTVSRAGTGHGLSVWFDAELADGIRFSNAPGEPELIYCRSFFPWLTPVALDIGDKVSVVFNADLIENDYVWRWNTRVADRQGNVKRTFEQSTFFGTPFSSDQLRKIAYNYQPRRGEDGSVDQSILSMMDGKTSLYEIAQRVLEQFPTNFANQEAALKRVSQLSLKYA